MLLGKQALMGSSSAQCDMNDGFNYKVAFFDNNYPKLCNV